MKPLLKQELISSFEGVNLQQSLTGPLTLIARRDVLLDYLYFVKSLDVLAGRNVSFDFTREFI